jgi:hypothetical protein
LNKQGLHLFERDAGQLALTNARMETTTKLQKAGPAFLLRLVAEYGPLEAAVSLRSLADEIEALVVPTDRRAVRTL